MKRGASNLSLVLILCAASMCGMTPARAGAGFTPGHVFVSVFESDPCDFGGLEVIVEIDPATGAASVFADSDDGICNVSGLRFTPEKQRLLALSAGRVLAPVDLGWVQAFNPDGTSTVIFDETDGIVRPFGANALAFDAPGNLYVLNTGNNTILRFPIDGGPTTVFADAADGIWDRGALDFALNGDLFYCGDIAGVIASLALRPMDSRRCSTIPQDRRPLWSSIAPAICSWEVPEQSSVTTTQTRLHAGFWPALSRLFPGCPRPLRFPRMGAYFTSWHPAEGSWRSIRRRGQPPWSPILGICSPR